jgi:hypothetical protein
MVRTSRRRHHESKRPVHHSRPTVRRAAISNGYYSDRMIHPRTISAELIKCRHLPTEVLDCGTRCGQTVRAIVRRLILADKRSEADLMKHATGDRAFSWLIAVRIRPCLRATLFLGLTLRELFASHAGLFRHRRFYVVCRRFRLIDNAERNMNRGYDSARR